ncbi:unnamed protein product [Blepharisma stoltei]|uniref:Aquaporin n=1 Tax=Blepharisma stoltei TaxID=1481888 RepID=A0AAU9IDZ8_9CILI|nr:unnamed protein product [Blepharisma stoltei]
MDTWRKWIGEAHGTALLTFIYVVTKGDPAAVGLGYWIIVIGCGFIGSAHFNPIITLSVFANKIYFRTLSNEESHEFIGNLFLQVIGSVIGGVLGTLITGSDHYHIKISENASYFEAILAEAFFTSQIILVFLIIQQRTEMKILSSSAVAMTLFASAMACKQISGSCFNPTLCMAVDLVKTVHFWDIHMIKHIWVYVLGPAIGGLIGVFFSCIFLGDKQYKPSPSILKENNSSIWKNSEHSVSNSKG